MYDSSVEYCRRFFGHYGRFATLRLCTAVLHRDEYDLSGFKRVFSNSAKDHENYRSIKKFMNLLDYADADYFSIDELQFFLRIASTYKDLTDEEIETERDQIKSDTGSGRISSMHSEYLLKALEYWKMHFKEEFHQWRDEFNEADKGWIQRSLIRVRRRQERTEGDDGYFSDDVLQLGLHSST